MGGEPDWEGVQRCMRPKPEIPCDPALPGLTRIRTAGLAAAIPALALAGAPRSAALCGYTPGCRATLEVWAGRRHFAVKSYAADPAAEAGLYRAFAEARRTRDTKVRTPALLAWNRALRVLAIEWLPGPTADARVKQGPGGRVGQLAAHWIRCSATLPLKPGRALLAGAELERMRSWIETLEAADPTLGATAAVLVRTLDRSQPRPGACQLVPGSLYARHLLDCGEGPGLIDWDRFGLGPPELDAGVLLATVDRLCLRHPEARESVAMAEEALLSGTEGLLDRRALAWDRASTLLRLAQKPGTVLGAERLAARGKCEIHALERARALLALAVRIAEAAG